MRCTSGWSATGDEGCKVFADTIRSQATMSFGPGVDCSTALGSFNQGAAKSSFLSAVASKGVDTSATSVTLHVSCSEQQVGGRRLQTTVSAELQIDVSLQLNGQDSAGLLGTDLLAESIDTSVTGGLSFSLSSSPTLLVAAGCHPLCADCVDLSFKSCTSCVANYALIGGIQPGGCMSTVRPLMGTTLSGSTLYSVDKDSGASMPIAALGAGTKARIERLAAQPVASGTAALSVPLYGTQNGGATVRRLVTVSPASGAITVKSTLTCNPQSLFFDCTGALLAVTGSNAAGEQFAPVNSLVRLSPTTGTATVVCPFTSNDRVQVGALISSTTVVHFFGTSAPVMETLSLSGQSAGVPCRTTVNTRYTSQASALFGGSPVAAAAADASASSGVFIAVGSKLYRVSSAGDVSAVGSVQDASASMSTVLLSGLVFLTALNRQCGASALSINHIDNTGGGIGGIPAGEHGSGESSDSDAGHGNSNITGPGSIPSSGSGSSMWGVAGAMIGAACVVVAVGVALVLKRRRTSPSSSVAVAKPGPRGPAAALGGAPQAAAVTVIATSGSHGPALTDGTSARKKGKGASGRRPQARSAASALGAPPAVHGPLASRTILDGSVDITRAAAGHQNSRPTPSSPSTAFSVTAAASHLDASTGTSSCSSQPLGGGVNLKSVGTGGSGQPEQALAATITPSRGRPGPSVPVAQDMAANLNTTGPASASASTGHRDGLPLMVEEWSPSAAKARRQRSRVRVKKCAPVHDEPELGSGGLPHSTADEA